ncbi:MAG: hypothetical protein WCG49_08860 [Actinomycetes bacterium]
MLFSDDEVNNPHVFHPISPDGLEENMYVGVVATVAQSLSQLSSEDHATRSSAMLTIVNEVLGETNGTDIDRAMEIVLFMSGVIGQMTTSMNHQWPGKGSELLNACSELHLSAMQEVQPYWGSPTGECQ